MSPLDDFHGRGRHPSLAPALQARANEILSFGSRRLPRVNSPILLVARSRRLGRDSSLHRTTYRSPPCGSAQAAQKGQFILPGVGPSKANIAANRCITITPKREGHCDTHTRLRAQGLGRFGVPRAHQHLVGYRRCAIARSADALCAAF